MCEQSECLSNSLVPYLFSYLGLSEDLTTLDWVNLDDQKMATLETDNQLQGHGNLVTAATSVVQLARSVFQKPVVGEISFKMRKQRSLLPTEMLTHWT